MNYDAGALVIGWCCGLEFEVGMAPDVFRSIHAPFEREKPGKHQSFRRTSLFRI
jgi:hypothetical protein